MTRGGAVLHASLTDAAAVRDFITAAALLQGDRIRHFIETAGLHPDSTFEGKPTALCYAALKADSDLTGYLLARGADVNHTDGAGMTPLHYGTLGGCAQCLVRLMDRGARLNAPNQCGQTPLALAASRPGLVGCRDLLASYGGSLTANTPGARRLH